MPTTRFNDALGALLAAYQGAPALSGIPVYDGIQAQTASDPACVIVGHDGTIEADGTLVPDALAGTYIHRWLYMGNPGVQQETGTVNCVIVCQSGDAKDLPGRRQQAATLLGALEDAAAANGGYTAPGSGLTFDGTSDGRWIYRQSLAGAAVMVAYRVSYSTEW